MNKHLKILLGIPFLITLILVPIAVTWPNYVDSVFFLLAFFSIPFIVIAMIIIISAGVAKNVQIQKDPSLGDARKQTAKKHLYKSIVVLVLVALGILLLS